MPISQAIPLTYKEDLFNGVHEPGDTYKIALYTSAATLDKNTTAYTATGEVVGTGYTAGGATLTGRSVGATGDVRHLSWTDPTWPASTITARGALIYNDTAAGKNAIAVLDFGSDVTSTNGTFTVDLPAAGASALLRIP